MVYCQSGGTQNEDGATFCKKCGHDLHAGMRGPIPAPAHARGGDCDDDCERDCYGTRHGKSAFWGIIIIIVGVWILFEVVISEMPGVPDHIKDFDFWWVIALIVGVAIIMAGVRAIMGGPRRR